MKFLSRFRLIWDHSLIIPNKGILKLINPSTVKKGFYNLSDVEIDEGFGGKSSLQKLLTKEGNIKVLGEINAE